MSNLHLRIIFGSIYVAVMVFSVLASSPYFEYLMAIFTILSVRETAILANKKSSISSACAAQLVSPQKTIINAKRRAVEGRVLFMHSIKFNFILLP